MTDPEPRPYGNALKMFLFLLYPTGCPLKLWQTLKNFDYLERNHQRSPHLPQQETPYIYHPSLLNQHIYILYDE